MTDNFKISLDIIQLADHFNGILLDAYGVFWGGNEYGLLPGAKMAMEKLILKGKIIGILSNSTQLSVNEIQKIERFGLVFGKHYHFLITSGDVVKSLFQQGLFTLETPKKAFWLFGGPHPKYDSHKTLFEGSPFKETPFIDQADFIYLSVPHLLGEDQVDGEVFRKNIQEILPKKLPMVCPNPDRFAHEGMPPRAVVRQGTIAAFYEEMGGRVIYIGKPEKTVFEAAMRSFYSHGIHYPEEILMVGDTPETDIRGANAFGMNSALVTETGIMAERVRHLGIDQAIHELKKSDLPDYFLGSFSDAF